MKPLTIEELKNLEVGDWVWIIDTDSGNGTYAQTFCVGKDMLQFSTALNMLPPHIYSDYGKTWLAYKNKEQAEAKGEIVELPCKVGDTVWYIEYGYCYPNLKYKMEAKPIIVTEISWKRNRSGKDLGFALIANGTRYKFSSFGKTVFFTKLEAEQRLKELKGDLK